MSNLKILSFDIETSPNVGYFWSPGYKVSIGPENIVEERQVICIAYKWLGESKTHSLQWDDRKGPARDKKMLKQFAKEYAKADLVVAHNGDNFDIKWIKTRMLKHGLEPLLDVPQLDTLKEARRHFKFNSNKLDYIAKFIGQEGKHSMSFSDWKKVMDGNKKSLTKMVNYCKKDVIILEKVFLALRPYSTTSGLMQGVMGDRGVCPECGSSRQHKHSKKIKKAGQYQRYHCQDCGKIWCDSRQIKVLKSETIQTTVKSVTRKTRR